MMRIEDYRGRWLDARFDFNPSSHFDFYLDGKKVIEGQGTRREALAQCMPHLKIGVYRPGDERSDPSATRSLVAWSGMFCAPTGAVGSACCVTEGVAAGAEVAEAVSCRAGSCP